MEAADKTMHEPMSEQEFWDLAVIMALGGLCANPEMTYDKRVPRAVERAEELLAARRARWPRSGTVGLEPTGAGTGGKHEW